ncbi:sulfate transporter CysZ [Pseudomonas sp. F1_0610]|uniref:sulfate transporter CysZ n=1 Tax=Pseudomonas sp. F1_0610 TaxID=3114284 RepID=UPI0039C34481
MQAKVLTGPQYLQEGFNIIRQPGMRRFVIAPILINLLVFAGLIYYSITRVHGWIDSMISWLPDWLSWLQFILWILVVALMVLIFLFTFTMLCSIIAAPFYGLLAEKVEVYVRGEDHFPPFSWGEFSAMIPRTIGREMRKLGYFLPRALGLLVLSFIPGVNIVAAPLWLLFNIWSMAIQYIDYPADNNKVSWPEMLNWLQTKRMTSLSFGGITYLLLMVPILNLIVMPAAVAGGTVLWIRERQTN